MSLEHLVPITEYVPTIYNGVPEMDNICKGEDGIFNLFVRDLQLEQQRMCIQSSDEVGVLRQENIHSIVANTSTENLDFRKERLITRCNIKLPYSTIWLRNYLNSILGADNYDLQIDYVNDEIRLYGYLLNQNWHFEVNNTINKIKPCNMVFLNIPTPYQNVQILNWNDNLTWNSNSWDDTNKWDDFFLLPNPVPEGYIRESDTNTLRNVANYVQKIIVNDDVEIENYTKQTVANSVNVSFKTPEHVTQITKIQIVNEYGATVVQFDTLIPITQETMIMCKLVAYTTEI